MIGLAIGLLVARVGIPSFVVTLAFFLGLQGVLLKLIGEGGSVRFDDEVLRGLAIKNIARTAGWIGAARDRGRSSPAAVAAHVPDPGRARTCSTRRSAWC